MNVVLVDDEPKVIDLLSTLMRDLPGCSPKGFTRPDEALGWCSKNPCDLVLVDKTVGPPDGTEFIRRFRAFEGHEEVPVMMVAGKLDKATRVRALEAGATDFLSKPLDQTEFIVRTRNMLTLRRGQLQLAERADRLQGEVQQAIGELRAREQEVILRLSRAAEYREGETAGHLVRMGLISKLIAKNLGLGEVDQDLLLRAAPMHDVGKVAVPDKILQKPGELIEDEWEIVKRHTLFGHQILQGSTSNLLQAAGIIALTHHERYDGSGYPNGLSGEDIPLYGRIVAVADAFDSLLSPRPFREAWPPEQVAAFLQRAAGTQFDAACVGALLEGWDEALEIRRRMADEAMARG